MESFIHKNIIKLLNSYSYKEDFYFVMEYARGGELSKFIDKNKYISEKTAKTIFKQVYDAVKYMHSKNVVHRDLKPLNILFLDEAQEHVVVRSNYYFRLLILEFLGFRGEILKKI